MIMLIIIININQLLFISAIVFDYEYLFVSYISCAACTYFLYLSKLDGVTQYSILSLLGSLTTNFYFYFLFYLRVTFCNFFCGKIIKLNQINSRHSSVSSCNGFGKPSLHSVSRSTLFCFKQYAALHLVCLSTVLTNL
jgi:hypothetical protein